MANPSEHLTPGYSYGDTQSPSGSANKTIANSTLWLRLCEILQNDNSMWLTLVVSSLSTREGTRWLAGITASWRQSPFLATLDEFQPANRRMKNVNIWTSTGYFSNLTGSPVANCRFFHVIIPWHWKEPPGIVSIMRRINQVGFRERKSLWPGIQLLQLILNCFECKQKAQLPLRLTRRELHRFVLLGGLCSHLDLGLTVSTFLLLRILIVLLLMRVGLHWFQALSPKITPSRAISAVETPWRLGLTTSHGS